MFYKTVVQMIRTTESLNKKIPSLLTIPLDIDPKSKNFSTKLLQEGIYKYMKEFFLKEGLFLKRGQLEKELENWKIETIYGVNKTK